MSSSLQDLLTQEGFRRRNRSLSPAPPPLPVSSISLCRDRRSVDLLRPRRPDADAVAVLAAHAARFLREPSFRAALRDRAAAACLAVPRSAASAAAIANLETGIAAVERIAAAPPREAAIRPLRSAARLLSAAAALGAAKARGGRTCGVPNPHLAACAQLYLAVACKIERNDRAAARHLLQAFCDAPRLARRSLAPELWEQLFLPHLLHLKAWHVKEAEMLAALDFDEERDRCLKGLNRVFNEQLDLGTAKFAAYYRDLIKSTGKAAVAAPAVPTPLRSSYFVVSSNSSLSASPCSVNRSLYQAVFGDDKEHGGEDGECSDADRETEEGQPQLHRQTSVAHTDRRMQADRPAAWGPSRRPYSFRLFACRSDARRGGTRRSQVARPTPAPRDAVAGAGGIPLINLGRAVALISSFDSLSECETAVRVMANSWLDSQGDPAVEAALSTAAVMEGLLEVSFTSKDDEVLEFAMSILAELVARSEVNRQVVLNADPQLEILLRLLGSAALFLKAAALVYLLRPRAKQMLSVDWVPLVLRVLEHADQPQALFGIQCSPKSAAFYLLDQLLTGFAVDRNVENAKQVVALGGLGLLLRSLEAGEGRERKNAASLLATCVRADGSGREFLAANIRKDCILELLVGKQWKSNAHALSLLVELLCLRKRTQITNFLIGLRNEGSLNAMHILLVYLEQAPPEQRPLITAVLMQLDLLGDPTRYSIYREEGIDSLIDSLDCSNGKKVQDQCGKALLVLAGRFTSTGEPFAEAWLLKRAGLDDCPVDLYTSKEILTVVDEFMRPDEEENVIEDWLMRLSTVLLARGSNRFLMALSNCIANGAPSLARSCLVTVAWMSSSLSLLENVSSLWSMACSALIPRLLESLKYDRALEERVLASLTLLNFARNPECLSRLLPLSRDTEILLQDLTRFTWTAKEILFLVAADPPSVISLC